MEARGREGGVWSRRWRKGRRRWWEVSFSRFCSKERARRLILPLDGRAETFYLELVAVNPLDAALAIGGLQIETDAEEAGAVAIDAPQEIELAPRESLKVRSRSFPPPLAR